MVSDASLFGKGPVDGERSETHHSSVGIFIVGKYLQRDPKRGRSGGRWERWHPSRPVGPSPLTWVYHQGVVCWQRIGSCCSTKGAGGGGARACTCISIPCVHFARGCHFLSFSPPTQEKVGGSHAGSICASAFPVHHSRAGSVHSLGLLPFGALSLWWPAKEGWRVELAASALPPFSALNGQQPGPCGQ